MLTPIELIQATVDRMIKRRFGRIVNITSSSVKAPIDILGLSNGARSGLTGFVAGIARTASRARRHDQRPAAGPVRYGPPAHDERRRGQGAEDDRGDRRRRARQHPGGRFGTPDEFGTTCAFLCSAHAGYITGQNMLMDGGQYPGTY